MSGFNSRSNSAIPLFDRLLIESQSNCNRTCWFCPRTYDRSGKYLDQGGKSILNRMPTETILSLLDQALALGFTGFVGFHHYSEPLLDDRNIMLAQEARKRGMKPYLHTNGDMLKSDDSLCEEVKTIYQTIVVGLYDYETNDQLIQAKQYWKEKLKGSNLEFSAIGPLGIKGVDSMGVPKALVPTDSRMAIPDLIYANAPCQRPRIRMIIQHDGEMCNCCEDTYGAFKLGNVFQHSLEELWFSNQHLYIIENLDAGRRWAYPLCQNCPLPPSSLVPNSNKIEFLPRRYSLNKGT